MKTYLSSAQVADSLGMTRDALNAKIRAGTFAEPDVIEGDRFQGWAADTVERIRQQNADHEIFYDGDAAAELVTRIRQCAEYVRTYGDSATDSVAGIHGTTPLALLLIATRLENEVRNIAVWDNTRGRRHWPDANADPTIVAETQIPLPFDTVSSIICPVNTDNITRSAYLRQVADIISSVNVQMLGALRTPLARNMMGALSAERDKILAYADALAAEAPSSP